MSDSQLYDPKLVLEAANRIMHMDYPNELDREERLRRFIEDAQLVAGAYVLLDSQVTQEHGA